MEATNTKTPVATEPHVYNLEDSKGSAAFGELIKPKSALYEVSAQGYYTNMFSRAYFNAETGISIGMYDQDFYPGGGHAMSYSVGYTIQRADGTYSKGPIERWRSIARTWPKPMSIESFTVVDNKIMALVVYDDGEKKSEKLGDYVLRPMYAVYRDNATYQKMGLRQAIQSLHGKYNVPKGFDIVFAPGAEIVETDAVKAIPENAVVIMDNASYTALPMLHNRTILRVDQGINENVEADTLLYFAKDKCKNAKSIMLYMPGLADHSEDDSDIEYFNVEKYSQYLTNKLKEIYPEAEFTFAHSLDDIQESASDLYIIDRHKSERVGSVYKAKNVVKLPLYENGNISEMQTERILGSIKIQLSRLEIE